MTEPTPRIRPPAERVPSGIAALDTMLSGGFVPQRPYLVVGPSGTGKTTLALEFLCEGVRQGEETLLVTLEEPPNEMRLNHRGLRPQMDKVWVFDAIPDVMRYERAPFKDIAQVRDSVRFAEVPLEIRKTPELTSVEVTITALEQTLRMQAARRHYQRLVIDSLTALQYFCMKGISEAQGAQSFLRFLSDLGPTTLLTMEGLAEETDAPERTLARGEIRLFRWDSEGRIVRAIGVEKFRGSAHDVRLHPYRIGRQGIDIWLDQTIFRDGRVGASLEAKDLLIEATEPPGEQGEAAATEASVQKARLALEDEIRALLAAQVDVQPVRTAVAEAVLAAPEEPVRTLARLNHIRELTHHLWLGEQARASKPTPMGRTTIVLHFPEEVHHEVHLDRVLERIAALLGPAPSPPAPAGVPIAEPPAPPASAPSVVAPKPPAAEPPRVPGRLDRPSVPPPPPASPVTGPPSQLPGPVPPAPPLPAPVTSSDAFGPTFDSLAPSSPPPPAAESAVATAPRAKKAAGDLPRRRAKKKADPPIPLGPGPTVPPPGRRPARRRRAPPVEGASPGTPPPGSAAAPAPASVPAPPPTGEGPPATEAKPEGGTA